MTNIQLRFVLKSDATFGNGEGVTGLIDTEVQQDNYGLPFLTGRTLKGLLAAECAGIMFALQEQGKDGIFMNAAARLFGIPGEFEGTNSVVHFSDATLPRDFQDAVKVAVDGKKLTRDEVLSGLTAIRRQTAIDEVTGAPRVHSLRGTRVILRETPFEAELYFSQTPTPTDLMLLAACVKVFRRAGMGRNRGRGELTSQLVDDGGHNITEKLFTQFKEEVLK